MFVFWPKTQDHALTMYYGTTTTPLQVNVGHFPTRAARAMPITLPHLTNVMAIVVEETQ